MQDWARKVAAGDKRALARAATAIENREPEGIALLHEISAGGRRGTVVGVTGPPGAGKSTLVDALAARLRSEGHSVGILAVDPSSRLSGGAILGDRIRMQAHHADPGVFIRSMATRGASGGLAQATADLARLLEAAGMEFVIIETVGVGQDEVEIAALADVTVLVLVPGMGDDVQAMKAGIMEIADVFVINKADRPGVEQVEAETHAMLSLAPGGSQPPIVRTIATEGGGIEELVSVIRKSPRAEAKPRRTRPSFTIDHLGIAVPSLETALSFYEEQLGMSVSLRETVPQENVNVAMLPVGGPRLELLEPTQSDSVIGRFIDKHGPGLHHVALRVRDLQEAVARLREHGAKLLNDPRPGAGGHTYIFVHPKSAGGVLLELIQDREG